MTDHRQPHLQLPPSSTGIRPSLPDDSRHLIIVGSNGAGKTRFSDMMARSVPDSAFRISALNAIFDSADTDPLPHSIDALYAEAMAEEGRDSTHHSQLGRLITLLMRDELINLLDYKIEHHSDPAAELKSTRLDTVIRLWQEIFPDNKAFVHRGHLLFDRGDKAGAYGAAKLSPGEKAVIYYLGAITYAPEGAYVFVESPEIFLHPTVMQALWNRIEQLRPDCRFVYTTHDLDFAASRRHASVIWVRDFDLDAGSWLYEVLPPDKGISDEVYMSIVGARKPVLFIEGDAMRSIDSKLYPLIFPDFTVQSLGSCNKVIEATRTFNDLNSLHHMASMGIVDRDRRDAHEVEYLRRKRIMVPEVAEVENILMLEEVIRTVAAAKNRDENKVFGKVKRAIISQFRHDLHQQALLHTRHRVKQTMEYRIDGRFPNITALEQHIHALIEEINPRRLYEAFCKEFRGYVDDYDYQGILRVYNQKSMIPGSNVAGLCGLANKDEYIATILKLLRRNGPEAERLRRAIRQCFNLEEPTANVTTTATD